MSGWVKLHRDLMDKAIWHCATDGQLRVLITLLLIVNYEPNQWIFDGKTYTLEAGQLITSRASLAEKARVSQQTAKSALKLFKKLGFLTSKSTNKNTLITLTNWEFYQGANQQPNQQNNQPATQQATSKPTTIKEIKTKNKELRIERDVTPLAQPTLKGTRLPKDWEPSEALKEWAENERPDLELNRTIESFKDYWCAVAGQKGVKLDWDATFKNWVRRETIPRGHSRGFNGARMPIATEFKGGEIQL